MEKTASLCHPLPARSLFFFQNYFWFKSYLNLEIQGLGYFLSVWIFAQENWVICTVSLKQQQQQQKARRRTGPTGLKSIYVDKITLLKTPQEQTVLNILNQALFSFFPLFQNPTSPFLSNFGTKPLWADIKHCWWYFQHRNCWNVSHKAPTLLFRTLATNGCFTEKCKTLQEAPIQKIHPSFTTKSSNASLVSPLTLLYFVLKIITITNLGVLAGHRNIPSFLNPSMLSVYPAVQWNIYIYICICAPWDTLAAQVCASTGRVHCCTLLLSVPLLPMKNIRRDSPGDWSPLCAQKVQFCQREGGTSLLHYFNSFDQQCLEKLPRTTSKSQRNEHY